MARPTVMTKERKAEICQYISEGMTRERAAMMCGIHVETFYDHQKANPEFHLEVKKAESKCIRLMLAAIRRAAAPHQTSKERTRTSSGNRTLYFKGPNGRKRIRAVPKGMTEHIVEKVTTTEGHWQAAAWLLERRHPEDYGRVDRHLIHTTGRGTPLPSDYIAAISEALGYTGKLIPVDANALPLSTTPADSEPIDAEVLPQD